MWFRSAKVFRINQPRLDLTDFQQKLYQSRLKPCLAMDSKTKGWVEHDISEGGYLIDIESNLLIALGFEKKLLPVTVVNQQSNIKIRTYEKQEGVVLSKKRRKEVKEETHQALLAQALTVRSKVYLWINLSSGLLIINSTSNTLIDECIEALIKLKVGFEIKSLSQPSKLSPLMNEWLLKSNFSETFTLNSGAEFVDNKTGKIKIKYKNISPDTDYAEKIISSDKSVSKLFMTWNDRVSFAFDPELKITSIELIDSVKEEIDLIDETDKLVADFYLLMHELNPLLRDFLAIVAD